MAFHAKNLQNFKMIKKNEKLDLKKKEQQKWAILEVIFHACDIGNSASEYD